MLITNEPAVARSTINNTILINTDDTFTLTICDIGNTVIKRIIL